MATDALPAPPPEAVMLRLVRKARGVTVAEAAGAAGISKAWLSAIEKGHDTRTRATEGVRGVQASDEIVARLAAHLDISPERLEGEGQRPDAAAILREIQRNRAEQPAPQPPPPDNRPLPRLPDPDGYTRPAYGDPDLEAFARALEARPDMAPMLHRDIDQAVQVMAQRKRMLSAEARVAELEREVAALRAELAQARPERQGALPAASIPEP